jgi:hypothetical protein
MYAKVKGFISFEDNYLDVNNKMVMQGTNRQKASELGTNVHNDVSLEIIQSSDADDGINAGIKIKTTSIDTSGSVGKNVSITAESATIEGHTHISSKINAKEANIATLRGHLESESATVNEIINADVKVDTIKANIALASKISLNKGIIKDIRNNNTIHITSELEVDTISGDGNKFVLVIDDGLQTQQEINELQSEIKVMKKSEVILKNKLKTLIPKAKKIQEKLAKKLELSQLEKKTILNVKESKQKVLDLLQKLKQAQQEVDELTKVLQEQRHNRHNVAILNHSRAWGKNNRFEATGDEGLVYINTTGDERGRRLTYDLDTNQLVIR